jgi:DNA-binding MarR family transcriptional regulator
VDAPLDNTELEQYLMQLLRLLGPASGAADTQGTDDSPGSGAAPGDGTPDPAAADAPIPSVSASEARALIELIAARGIAQGELGQLLGLEKSTVSRLAAGLERKGWLRRGRDEGNQRYVRLYLTSEGRAVAEQVWRAWQSRQARIVAGLSDEERDGLSAGLRGLVCGLAAEGFLSPPGPPGAPGPPGGTPTPRRPGS